MHSMIYVCASNIASCFHREVIHISELTNHPLDTTFNISLVFVVIF